MKKAVKVSIYLLFILSMSAHSSPNGLYQKALEAESAGYLFEAIKLLEKEVELNPKNYRAQSKLGLLQFKVKEKEKAVDSMIESYQKNPFSVDTNFNLASMYFDMGDYQGAKRFFEQAAKIRPKFIKVKESLVKVYATLGMREDVDQTYHKIFKLDPENFQHYMNYGNYLRGVEDHIKASSAYSKAVLLTNRRDYRVLSVYGESLSQTPQTREQGIQVLREAISLNKEFLEAYYLLGKAFEMSGDLKKAKTNLVHVTSRKSDHFGAHYRLGHVERQLKNFSSSLQAFDQALKLQPKNFNILESRALTYIGAERYDKAAKEYFRITDIDPNYTKAYILRGWLHELVGNPEFAEREYRAAEKLGGNDSYEALAHLGDLFFTLRNFEQARIAYRRLSKAKPNNGVANYRLGVIYSGEEKYELSAYYFSRVPKNSEFFSQAAEKLEKIYLTRDPFRVDRVPASSKKTTPHFH